MQSVEPPVVMRALASASIIIDGEAETTHGAPAALADLPRNMRRRLSSFDRMAARCVMGLKDTANVDEPIVFASNYGNMKLTLDLLGALAAGEPMSPAAFSASVHNAAVGFASLLTSNKGGHVAVAAGVDSAHAGLIEACLRLAAGAGSVMLVVADEPLPGDYAAYDTEPECPAACVAIRLQAAQTGVRENTLRIEAFKGRTGIVSLARHVAEPPVEITWKP